MYGGDVVTFVGVNFVAVPTVTVDGVQCSVNLGTVNSTYFQCTTGSRLVLPNGNSFAVRFGNQIPILRD